MLVLLLVYYYYYHHYHHHHHCYCYYYCYCYNRRRWTTRTQRQRPKNNKPKFLPSLLLRNHWSLLFSNQLRLTKQHQPQEKRIQEKSHAPRQKKKGHKPTRPTLQNSTGCALQSHSADPGVEPLRLCLPLASSHNFEPWATCLAKPLDRFLETTLFFVFLLFVSLHSSRVRLTFRVRFAGVALLGFPGGQHTRKQAGREKKKARKKKAGTGSGKNDNWDTAAVPIACSRSNKS